MKRFRKEWLVAGGLLMVAGSGCWLGGNTRSNTPTPANSPAPPALGSPQLAPSGPVPQTDFKPPALDGPAFPQSSADPPFDRQRHSQQIEEDVKAPNYVGTMPPIIPDGPIAEETPKREINVSRTREQVIELPPAP